MKIIYVAGTSHCGSTLLAFLLNMHPRLISVGEASPSLKRAGRRHEQPCSCGELLGTCQFWHQVFDRVSRQGIPFTPNQWAMKYFSNRRLRNALFIPRTHRARELLRRLGLRLARRHLARGHRANRLAIQAILEVAGKEVFADTSKNPCRANQLRRAPGIEVHLVWLVRDLRGFVASMKRRGWEPAAAVRRWEKEQVCIGRVFESFEPAARRLLRFEELLDEPQARVNDLYQMVGLEPFWQEDFRAADHHIIGHRMRLDPENRTVRPRLAQPRPLPGGAPLVVGAAGSMARELGYA